MLTRETLQLPDEELLDLRSELFDRAEWVERDSEPAAAIKFDVSLVNAALQLRRIGLYIGVDPVRFVECLVLLSRARDQLGIERDLEGLFQAAAEVARRQPKGIETVAPRYAGPGWGPART